MRFRDVYMPDSVAGFPAFSSPMFSTDLVEANSGDESANENWANARQQYRLPKAIRSHATVNDLRAHWYVMRGPASLWPFRDPQDFASIDLHCPNVVPGATGGGPAVSRTDQLIGVGDGLTTQFQLVKTYTRGGLTYERTIQLPVVSTVLVGMNGVDPDVFAGGPWTVAVEREGGIVTITPAPADSVAITAGFLFDVAVRFENDSAFDAITESMHVSGSADLTLIERRLC